MSTPGSVSPSVQARLMSGKEAISAKRKQNFWIRIHQAKLKHAPFFAQLATLVTCLTTLILCLVAYSTDSKWTAELQRNNFSLHEKISDSAQSVSGNVTLPPDALRRERKEFMDSLLCQAYVIFAILFHLVNYWICTESNYRVQFARLLNFGLMVINTASLLLILQATLDIDTIYYNELKDIGEFERCKIGQSVGTKDETGEMVNLSGTQDGLLCHRYELRFAAIGVSVFTDCIMLGILLFARDDKVDKNEDTGDLLLDNEYDSRIHIVLDEDKSEANNVIDTKESS